MPDFHWGAFVYPCPRLCPEAGVAHSRSGEPEVASSVHPAITKAVLGIVPQNSPGINLHLIAFPASPAHTLSFLLRAASIFTRVWTQCLLPGNRSRPREAEEWCWKKEAQADPTLHVVLGTSLTQTLFQAFTSEMAVRSSNFRWSSGV